jgi:hypothetical protein
VSDVPAARASDADRDRTITLLREHTVVGRLTLEEFTDRMSTAARARTQDDLEQLTRDLPAVTNPVASRRARTRFLLSLFSSTERTGRIRVGRRVACLMAFGNIDLDLRHAMTETDVITIFSLGLFGAVDVYVPEGVEVDLHGLAVFGHKGERGNDALPLPGTPLVRVITLSFFAGVDVWHVPRAWSQRTFREVIRGIRAGDHKELEA